MSLPAPKVPASSERLTFRLFEDTDVPALVKLCDDPEIEKHMLSIPSPYTEHDAREWIGDSQSHDEHDQTITRGFAICLPTGELVGSISFRINRHDVATVGYWIGQPYRQKGYCSEALLALLQWLFTETHANSVRATHWIQNPVSGRVMLKCWMTYEGILYGWHKKNDQYYDAASYSILKSAFKNITSRGVRLRNLKELTDLPGLV